MKDELKAILFDIDGTVLNNEPAAAVAGMAVIAILSGPHDRQDLKSASASLVISSFLQLSPPTLASLRARFTQI